MALVVFAHSIGRADAFNVTGRVDRTSWNVSGSLLITNQFDFDVTVRGSSWNIILRTDDTRLKPHGLVSWEMGSDGTDTFILDRYYTGPAQAEKEPVVTGKNSGKNQPPPAMARIISGSIPYSQSAPFGQIWLAYAAGPYLQSKTTNRLRQVWEFTTSHDNFDPRLEYKADWKITGDFASQVNYYNEGGVIYSKNGLLKSAKFPQPWGLGFLEATYSAYEFIQFGGKYVPSQAQFKRYFPTLKSSNTNDINLISDYLILANKVNSVNRESLLPALPSARVAVADYRNYVSIGAPISYSVSNREWPNVEKVMRLKTYHVQHAIALRKQQELQPNHWRRYTVYAPLVAILVISFIIAAKNKKKNT